MHRDSQCNSNSRINERKYEDGQKSLKITKKVGKLTTAF